MKSDNKKDILDKLDDINYKMEILDTANNFIDKKLIDIQTPQIDNISDSVKLWFIQGNITDYIVLNNNAKDMINDVKKLLKEIYTSIQGG